MGDGCYLAWWRAVCWGGGEGTCSGCGETRGLHWECSRHVCVSPWLGTALLAPWLGTALLSPWLGSALLAPWLPADKDMARMLDLISGVDEGSEYFFQQVGSGGSCRARGLGGEAAGHLRWADGWEGAGTWALRRRGGGRGWKGAAGHQPLAGGGGGKQRSSGQPRSPDPRSCPHARPADGQCHGDCSPPGTCQGAGRAHELPGSAHERGMRGSERASGSRRGWNRPGSSGF